MRVAVWNHEKFTKTPYFGGSRSFKVINVNIPKKLIASACLISSMSVPICNHFHVRQANIQSDPKKTDTKFYFWDNFGNSAPILTILSLLQAEIYGA